MWSTHKPYLDYFLYVLVASIGTLQITAAYAKLNKFLFFKNPIIGYITGFIAIVLAFWWFFAAARRIGHNYIAGTQQFALFIAGVAGAILVSLIVSFFIKYIETSIAVKFKNNTCLRSTTDCSQKGDKE